MIRRRLAAGTYYITVSTAGTSRGPYALHLRERVSPGATIAAATSISHRQAAGGNLSSSANVGYFEIDPTESTETWIGVYSGDVRIEASLVDGDGDPLDKRSYDYTFGSTANPTAWGWVLIDTLDAGPHYIKVTAPSGSGSYSVLVLDRYHYAALVALCGKLNPNVDASITDPLYGCQWHLDNSGQLGGVSGEDINVDEVWSAGILGAGVNVAVIDDGIHDTHADLDGNLDPSLNHYYGTKKEFPSLKSHGLSMSGVIAGRDNDIGIRGVAPRATVFGYDLFADPTPENQGDAMTRAMATTAVSSHGLSPKVGAVAASAPEEWETAVDSGVSDGYGGKGVFYVQAAGNEAVTGGYATLDEYANHYGVTVVCAVNNQGDRARYSERGANLWVCAPSSDRDRGRPDILTLAYDGYKPDFGGTSAATAVVSGVAALVRGAYPDLSWRDVKLILAGSARKNDEEDPGWQTGVPQHGATAERYEFNHSYGFGVVDAKAAVDLAAGWQSLPEMAKTVSEPVIQAMSIPTGGTRVSSSFEFPAGTGTDFTEFVEVQAILRAPSFRHLRLELVSPSGAVSELSVPWVCLSDRSCAVNSAFRFGTARHLGEDPAGQWTLRAAHERSGGSANTVTGWNITVYGHKSKPDAPILEPVETAPGSLTVRWAAPGETGTSDVSAYDVRHIRSDDAGKDADSAWTVFDRAWTSGALQHTITSLIGGVQYDLQVRAVNNRGGGAWSDTVTGTPDNSPPFFVEGTVAERTVSEDTTADQAVGRPLTAHDAEGDELTYTLRGPDAGKFSIDTTSGLLSTSMPLDHETTPTLAVVVTVSDGKNATGDLDTSADATIVVTVTVGDVDEPPELVGETAPDYAENGLHEVTTFTATDPEGEGLAWTLTGDDRSHFTIDAGRLAFADPPDYENPQDRGGDNVYEITIQVSDGDKTADLDVTVNVTNIDEQGALSLSSRQPQQGTAVTARVEDPDGAVSGEVWVWERSPDRADWTAVPGAASASYTPSDDDVDKWLRVAVTYRDGHGPDKTAGAAPEDRVQAKPASNTAPRFPATETGMRHVFENTDPDRPVGAPVSAVDDDTADLLTYSLAGGGGLFDIDPSSGQLLIRGALDFEQTRSYVLTVTAADSSQARASRRVTVSVDDVDEDGALTLSPPVPREGTPVTATLTDPDTASSATWQWDSSPDGLQDWTPITGAMSRTYTPTAADKDRYLRATATYNDRHSNGIRLQADTQIAVQDSQPQVIRPNIGGITGNSGGNSGSGGSSSGGQQPDPPEQPVQPVQPAPAFTDVDAASPHTTNIAALRAAGITTGCNTNPLRYCPQKPVTRAQMATFLTRALNLATPQQPPQFTDVDPNSPHAANIAALHAAGITTGCNTNPLRYCPQKPVTRAQMATFLTRALNLATPQQPPQFTDVDPGNAHAANIAALHAAGITTGCNTNPLRYCPLKPVTRAQMATFLTRALNL